MRRFILLFLLPIALMGATTVSQNLNIDVTQQAQPGTCPMGSAYADGCSNAPAGTIQYPSLLARYGANRPPWNVAGVDYHVGMPSGQTITPWTTTFAACLATPNTNCSVGGATWQWQTNYNVIACVAGNATLNGIDFTAGTINAGGYVPGCSGLTITNSKFGCIPGAGASAGWSTWHFQNTSGHTNLVFDNNTVDFSGCVGYGSSPTNQTAFLWADQICQGSSCTVELKYNYFRDIAGGPFFFGGAMSSFTHEYNVVESPVTCTPACTSGQYHMNSLSWGSGGNVTNAKVAFNTEFSSLAYAGAAEFYQMYNNGGGSFTSPVVANNTFPASSTGCSYMVHGNTGYSGPSTTVTNGSVTNNYFDITGCFGAFYPSSMTSAQGWSSSGNINMLTGGTVTPL
jgi:hypothetical protein